MTGMTREAKLKLANLGPYTAGGWDMAKIRQEIGCNCFTGMMCNASWDPYGCKIEPWGCELLLCVPTDLAATGNLFSQGNMGEVDFSLARLQLWKDGAEVPDGFVAPEDCTPWVLLFVR